MKITLLLLTLFISEISISQDAKEMVQLKFEGTYTTGRAPCELLADGSRRWALTNGFQITSLIEGNLEVEYLEISCDLDKSEDNQLKTTQSYLVTMKLSKERFAELKLAEPTTLMTYRNPIKSEEILRIEKVE